MASPFIIDRPSAPLSPPPRIASPVLSRSSTEAFPDFPLSPRFQLSANSQKPTQSSAHLGVPGQGQPARPNRPIRSTSQRFPPTALLPASRNGSRTDLTSPMVDNGNHEEPPQQRLPRAMPAPSLAGPSLRPTGSIAPGLLRGSIASIARPQPNAEELKSESLWADMQRTLADVELSAMSSSHLFNAKHSRALEKLRETQLALAQAWARSEADETVGQESEDEYLDSEPEGGIPAANLGGPRANGQPPNQSKDAKTKGPKDPGSKPTEQRARQGSTGSQIGHDLEEQTERDIRLARKRREANDHYFSQVNRGVVDVVGHLDEVASAMRTVEKESRAVWNEMGGSGSSTDSATELDNETEDGDQRSSALLRQTTKGTATTDTHTGSGTELSDSPTSPHVAFKKSEKEAKSGKATNAKKSTANDKGR